MLDVLSLVTSLAMQELECGKLTYRQAIKNSIQEVCIRLNSTREELIKEL